VSAPPVEARHNLRIELSSFVGRERELRDLLGAVPATRLLTLTGPGGTGKTRLAQQTALGLTGEFGDGVMLVELASIADPALVPSQIGAVLGVREVEGRSAEESLVEFLEPRHLLLVLDNLEQVPGIAPLVSRLLAACARVHVLATSRIPLHLRDEREYAVSPLDVPDPAGPQTPEAIGGSGAAALFADRATAVRADFRISDRNAVAVGAICVRLDGLPLAIELAAARVKLLSPSQILDRLGDRLGLLTGGPLDLPERHQTLRATISWSHELLDEPSQALFRRLSVMEGSLTFAAAEAICADEPDDFLDRMTALVDGSLLRPIATGDDEPRFAMLETIREYAAERLVESGEADWLRRRHFEHFFDLGRRFEAELGEGDLVGWLHRLDADHANLVAAMEWGIGAGEVGRAAELFDFLRDYSRAHGRTTEARSLLGRLLGSAGLDDAKRRSLLHEAAVLAVRQGDLEASDRFAAEALALAREAGDTRRAVGALHLLAVSAGERGDGPGEAEFIRQMVDDADRSGDPRMEILARSHVALRSLRGEEYDDAVRFYDDVIARMRTVDVMRESMGAAWFNRGIAALHAGRLAEAAASLAESAAIGREMEDADLLGYVLEGYAALAAATGRPGLAARLSGASGAALAEVDSVLEAFEAAMRERTAASVREAIGDAAADVERAAGAALSIDEALDLALSIGTDLAAARSSEPAV
jgi:predicted ATPase